MEHSKYKVAAVVVTYNRKNLLKECIDALLNQTYPLSKIIIVDNASTDGTEQFLKENEYLNNSLIEYVKLPENVGGAGGFYHGMKLAYLQGYDWIWLMDDDSETKPDALFELVKHMDNQVQALSCLKVSPDGKILTNHRGDINYSRLFNKIIIPINEKISWEFKFITHSSFVGLLISRDIIKQVGYPKKEFFIYYDDVEYCIRISKISPIKLISKSIIIHKGEDKHKGDKKHFLWLKSKSSRVKISQYWQVYYSIRNVTYLSIKYQLDKIRFYFFSLYFILRTLGGILLYDDYKLARIKLVLKSYIDGLKGRLGKTIDPQKWSQKFLVRKK